MLAISTQVKEVTTPLVHLVGALSLQDGDLVGELLAEWAVSSPHAGRQFAVVVRLAQPSCVHDVRQALKENVDKRGGYPPLRHATGANRARKLRGVLPQDLFRRRSSNLFQWCSSM